MNATEPAKDLLVHENAEEAGNSPAVAAVAAPLQNVDAWQVIQVLPRLDSESQTDLMTQIHEVLAVGCNKIALDLTQTQFVSLGAIQLCMTLARDLAGDDGALALVGCNERTKKHFDVYGSLKQIAVVRSLAELVSDRRHAVVIKSRSSQAPR